MKLTCTWQGTFHYKIIATTMQTNIVSDTVSDVPGLTGGLNSSITEIRPYIPMSRCGLRPSGVTTWISRRVFFAMIKLRSSGAVKLPTTAAFTAVGL